jgi:hypothetical protein
MEVAGFPASPNNDPVANDGGTEVFAIVRDEDEEFL